MITITPYLWFNSKISIAVEYYSSVFHDFKLIDSSQFGEVETATFSLLGQKFYALNGGPVFAFTPSISFFVSCRSVEEIDQLYAKLSNNGSVLMELDKYDFSERFAWVNDKFGVSWQLSLANNTKKIINFLMFSGKQFGKAKEAAKLYMSLFTNSDWIQEDRLIFSLEGQHFMVFDSEVDHAFNFSPAVSFFITCNTQEEIDWFWDKLSEEGEEQMCGWLKDRFGISWQVIPYLLDDYWKDKDQSKVKRVMDAMLKMKKINIKLLQEAYNG